MVGEITQTLQFTGVTIPNNGFFPVRAAGQITDYQDNMHGLPRPGRSRTTSIENQSVHRSNIGAEHRSGASEGDRSGAIGE